MSVQVRGRTAPVAEQAEGGDQPRADGAAIEPIAEILTHAPTVGANESTTPLQGEPDRGVAGTPLPTIRASGARTERSRPSAALRPGGRRRSWWPSRRWMVGLGLVLVVVVGALAAFGVGAGQGQGARSTPGLEVVAPPKPKLTARGHLRPVAQARVGTLTGGVVVGVFVQVGDVVEEQAEIARVRTGSLEASSIEVLTAPWRGTVTSLSVQTGDTVMAGTVVATVADLSRLQVETDDVDEFLIGQVRRGQTVRITVDAVEGRTLQGEVRTVGLQTRATSAGDQHYPVTVEIPGGAAADLRPGMTVRVDFGTP